MITLAPIAAADKLNHRGGDYLNVPSAQWFPCFRDFPPFFLAPGEVFFGVAAAEAATQTRELAEANRDRAIEALRGNGSTYGNK